LTIFNALVSSDDLANEQLQDDNYFFDPELRVDIDSLRDHILDFIAFYETRMSPIFSRLK